VSRGGGQRRRAAASILVWLAAAPPFAFADSPTYRVDLEAPAPYRKLLEEQLEIYAWLGDPAMSPEQFRILSGKTRDRIAELMATQGYYSPRILSSLEQTPEGWAARFSVEPGEPTLVRGVELRFSGEIADGSPENRARIEKLRETWPLPDGRIFRQEDWEAAKRTVLQEVSRYRYPAAKIAASRATVDPEARQARLEVEVDSGPPFTFGGLEISGLRRYPASVVERLNPIRPGSPYSRDKLLDYQGLLQDTRYFGAVTVSAEADPAHSLIVPVRVEVVEAPSRKLGFGAGFSTNTGVRGQVTYQDFNLRGLGWRLDSLVRLETKRQTLSGDLHFPLTAAGHRNSLTAAAERTDVEGEITEKYALGAKRTRVRGTIETVLSAQYQTERQGVAGAAGETRQALTANYSWTARRTDSLLYPTRGYTLNAQVGSGVRALLSDQDFVRAYGKLAVFFPVDKVTTLILRGELGAVAAPARRGIPSEFLFRAGGDQSVRGYAYQSLGVREGDAVVGGRCLAAGSVELVRWFSDQWGGAVFYDVGDAADTWNSLDPASGYGLGLRWRSPVGPLNLDAAYGRRTEEFRLHFSVGFAF
jgi:translocation and assembly module TamA